MIGHVATAEIEIDAPAARVWAALTDPEQDAFFERVGVQQPHAFDALA